MTDQLETETDWKREYRTLVREFETSEHAWHEAEALLRRAGTQIAIAAMGQSQSLDRILEDVVEALKGEVEPNRLEDPLGRLSEALHRMPQRPRAVGSDVATVMREIVARVAAAPVLRETPEPLGERIERALGNGDWAGLAHGLADAVARLTKALELKQLELQTFLGDVTTQLERFETWNSWTREADAARRQESSVLESTVGAEMQGIRVAVDDAADVASLKRSVQTRLAAVAAGFSRFREREALRENEAEARTAALTDELDSLRNRTKELTQVIEKKEEQLLHDTLTGAHSRYAYEQRLAEEFQRWQRHGGHLSFALWDIDRFKSVNDRLGHAAGDRLLKLVAGLLAEGKRREDFVARIGGEEFAMLLPATPVAQAVAVVDRIRLSIAGTPFHFQSVPEQVTISCGLTAFRDGDSPETVYERADAALYRAKEAGRNRSMTG